MAAERRAIGASRVRPLAVLWKRHTQCVLKGQSHRDRKQVSGCRGLVGTEGLTAEGHEERFG